MGIRRGDLTRTLGACYASRAITHAWRSVFHAVFIMACTFERNNERDGGKRQVASFVIRVVLAALFVFLVLNELLGVVLDLIEITVVLISSPLGILLSRITRRTEHVNTFLYYFEKVFNIEFQKTITTVVIKRPRCKRPAERGSPVDQKIYGVKPSQERDKPCFQHYGYFTYKEIDHVCLPCARILKDSISLAYPGQEFENISVRGGIASELPSVYGYLWGRVLPHPFRVIESENGILHNKDYDVDRFLWKMTYTKFVREDITSRETQYEFQKERVDRIVTHIKLDSEEYIALKAFASNRRVLGKTTSRQYNNADRKTVKVAGSGILVGVQLLLNVAGVFDERRLLDILLFTVGTQVTWFTLISEAVLSDMQWEAIKGDDFDMVSARRSLAIRYLANGDLDNAFSGEHCSWVNKIQIGNLRAKPVTAFELLLNADIIVTDERAWSFNRSGSTVRIGEVSIDKSTNIARINGFTTTGNPSQTTYLTKCLVGGDQIVRDGPGRQRETGDDMQTIRINLSRSAENEHLLKMDSGLDYTELGY